MEYLAFLSPIDRLPPPSPLERQDPLPTILPTSPRIQTSQDSRPPSPGIFFISFCNILARVKIARNGERNPQGCSGMLGDARGRSGIHFNGF